MTSVYKTIVNPSEGLYKDKGSKFISLSFPVSNLVQVESILGEVRNKYHDARHHCYAYILGIKEQSYKANDDGEPNHAAGDPILGQIRAFEMTNVLVVVVRYFGGIKLGVGGLVTAYKTAAEVALVSAQTKEIFPMNRFEITFPYELTGEMERIFNDFSLIFEKKEFTDYCYFQGSVRDDESEQFSIRLQLVYGIEYSLND